MASHLNMTGLIVADCVLSLTGSMRWITTTNQCDWSIIRRIVKNQFKLDKVSSNSDWSTISRMMKTQYILDMVSLKFNLFKINRMMKNQYRYGLT
jgi:hypothetical protein